MAKKFACHADGRSETVGLSEAIIFDLEGRDTAEEAMVLGDEVLIGQTVLEAIDMLADCKNRRLIPNPKHPEGPVFRVGNQCFHVAKREVHS